jgi:hypothetical protein
MLYGVHIACTGFELTTLVVIGIDCIEVQKVVITTTTILRYKDFCLPPDKFGEVIKGRRSVASTMLWKVSLNNNGQQFNQYKKNPLNWRFTCSTQKQKSPILYLEWFFCVEILNKWCFFYSSVYYI